jgi:hypothetical protein
MLVSVDDDAMERRGRRRAVRNVMQRLRDVEADGFMLSSMPADSDRT